MYRFSSSGKYTGFANLGFGFFALRVLGLGAVGVRVFGPELHSGIPVD